jgi:ribose transport system permease protein
MTQTEAAPAKGFNAGNFFADQLRNIAPVFTLVALVIFFSFASPTFLSLDNGMNILRQMSITGIIAVGLTFVILTAEIDLSVAAVANAVGITVAYFTIQPDYVNIANMPVQGWIAIILALAAALTFGLITAFGMTWIGIPSFIMTLAIMQIANGISAILVRGQIAYQYPDLVTTLGSKTAFTIPLGVDEAGKTLFIPIGWTMIVFIVFLVVAHLVLTYTRFGRYVYMVGGNREAAEYSGVNVKLVIGAVMVIGAFCSGVAGMLGVAYFGSAQQNQFDTFLLDAIAAVVVGGTSLFGGRGGIGNTIIGLLVLGVVNNGLDHIQMDSFQKILIRGLILLAALVINVYAQSLRERQQAMD